MGDDIEPRIEIQARICPICIDDHSENRRCHYDDLVERIASLKAERDELAAMVQALEDADFVLAGSIEIEGQSDALLEKREDALMRFFEALGAYRNKYPKE